MCNLLIFYRFRHLLQLAKSNLLDGPARTPEYCRPWYVNQFSRTSLTLSSVNSSISGVESLARVSWILVGMWELRLHTGLIAIAAHVIPRWRMARRAGQLPTRPPATATKDYLAVGGGRAVFVRLSVWPPRPPGEFGHRPAHRRTRLRQRRRSGVALNNGRLTSFLFRK
jgi:hypothetical protein